LINFFVNIKIFSFFSQNSEKSLLQPLHKEKLFKMISSCAGIRDEHVEELGASLCEFQKGLRVLSVNFSE